MNKIIYAIVAVLCATFSLNAQVTITVTVTNVSVDYTNSSCDLDGLGAGDSDPEWDATLSDNRNYDETFRHEISETNVDVMASSGFDNPLTFSQTYTTVCPPNFLSVEWSAYDDDAIGTDANTGTQNAMLPIVTAGALILGTNSYSFSANVTDCGGTTWSMTYAVTVSGTAPYFCSDTPCDASPQIIQDGCDNAIVITRYDVSNSTSTFPASSTSCGIDGNNDIFFSFVAPPSGEIVMDMDDYGDFVLFGLTNLTINLYEGPCTNLVLVDTETYFDSNGTAGASADCIDLSGGIFNSNYTPIYFGDLTPGQTYFIRMSEEDDDNSFADLAFEAIVENDDCVDALQLAGSTVYSGCNYNATPAGELSNPDWTGGAHTGTFGGSPVQTCSGWSSNENAVWYYFDVTDATVQPITLDVLNVVCEGGANTLQMGVWYAGTGPSYSCDLSSMPGVGCDVGTGTVSVTLGNDVPNGRYYVMLDGNAGAQCVWDFQSPQILKIALSPKVFLQGPLSGTLMNDDLRVAGLIPPTEPYTALGYTFVGGGGGESAAAGAFGTTGAMAVIDWVIVELRDGSTGLTIIESRAALLLANGMVVEIDGVSPVTFNAASGTYHVAIQHRNHLAVMTGTAIGL